ncbi:MAG: hypothetical protein AAF614_06180 [Chloroflexota bacterium]
MFKKTGFSYLFVVVAFVVILGYPASPSDHFLQSGCGEIGSGQHLC